jgi:ABC-type lipoprotein export system ATPase subunit
MLLVTHDAEVGAFCDRIIHMRNGLIRENASRLDPPRILPPWS